MPANLVDGSDADDVAVYVALCAANPTCGVKASTTTPHDDDHDADDDLRRRRVADGAREAGLRHRPAAAAATP